MKKLTALGGLAAAAVLSAATPAAHAQQVGYASTTANVRAGPSEEYPVVAVAQPGVALTVFGCQADYRWCDVDLGGNRGWVWAGSISYPYRGSRVPVLTYGAALGIGVLAFGVASYWDTHYRGRPWYPQRDLWMRRPQPAFAPRDVRIRQPGPGFGPGPGFRPNNNPPRMNPQGGMPPRMNPPGTGPRMNPQGNPPRMNPQGMNPQGMPPRTNQPGMPPRNNPQGMNPQGTSPRTNPPGMNPPRTTPQGMNPQGTQPRTTTPQGTQPRTTPQPVTPRTNPQGTTQRTQQPQGTHNTPQRQRQQQPQH